MIKLFKKECKFELIYQGSRDSFTAESFHSNCDNKGKTLTVILAKETQKIFGAFTNIPWKSPKELGRCVGKDGKSFIFSIRDDQIEILKNVNKSYEVYHKADALACFAYAFSIYDKCDNLSK